MLPRPYWQRARCRKLGPLRLAVGAERPWRGCCSATDNHGGGWEIDTTDGTRPGNLTWLGDRVWIDNHIEPFHGPSLDRSDGPLRPFAATINEGWAL